MLYPPWPTLTLKERPGNFSPTAPLDPRMMFNGLKPGNIRGNVSLRRRNDAIGVPAMAKGWRHPGRRAVEAEAGQGFDAARRMVPHVWPNPG